MLTGVDLAGQQTCHDSITVLTHLPADTSGSGSGCYPSYAGRKFIKVYLHTIQRDDGSGGQSDESIYDAYDRIYEEYLSHDIQLVPSPCGILPHKNTSAYNADGINLIPASYKHQDGIDLFFLGNDKTGISSGATGTVPSIAMLVGGKDKRDTNYYSIDTYTPIHEFGHCLGLYHTFKGYQAELVQDDSCCFRGDLVCDTPPGPGDHPNTQNTYTDSNSCVLSVSATDSLNNLYDPDEKNFMTYTHPNCAEYFTQEQVKRMHYVIENDTLLGNAVFGMIQLPGK